MKANIVLKVLKINNVVINDRQASNPAVQSSFKTMVKKTCETLVKFLNDNKIVSEVTYEIPKYEPRK